MIKVLGLGIALAMAFFFGSSTCQAEPQQLALETVGQGFNRPVKIAIAPGQAGKMFIVEQGGLIKMLESGQVRAQPLINLTSKINASGNEAGLLGIAFHPEFDSNGYFFVNYTADRSPMKTKIVRYQADLSTLQAGLASEKVLLTFDQPYGNHNGGNLEFGPDGYLYIGTGDGGAGGDPQNFAQNLQPLAGNKHFLGKMLRIDVDSGTTYAIPRDNPNLGGRVSEIWAYGLRNPWRYSFDSETGVLWAGDVGQNKLEEVTLVVAGGNHGWKIMEGDACFSPAIGCNTEGLVMPVHTYPRSQGVSITGGHVYRGDAIPSMKGWYVFADFAFGNIWALNTENTSEVATLFSRSGENVSSFGVDASGEMYFASFSGKILKIVPAS